MRSWFFGLSSLAAGTCLSAGAASASVVPVAVGAGDATSHVVINFADGAAYQFDVSYASSAPAPSGVGLMHLIRDNTSLALSETDYGSFGVFIDGITYGGHANVGFAGGENWWHFWTRGSDAAAWTSPDLGAGANLASGGTWDGWVYGTAASPVPEPVSAALLVTSCVPLLGRRSRGTASR